jgi:uncharacterized flavoprotein (TIGR03862 family)
MTPPATAPRCAAVIGGGPAGLMAAQVLAEAGAEVDLFDTMPSVGRKFLLAGKGGLNLTHSEAFDPFCSRYGSRRPKIEPLLREFGPDAVCDWARGLGIQTFVGSSGRIFPSDLKAAPLLRAWLHRLRAAGVRFHMRQRWMGWGEDGALRFTSARGERDKRASVTVLALGGASWPQLGSDGAWVPLLAQRGVPVAPLQPANCGFDVAGTALAATGFSEHFVARFAGAPVKPVTLTFDGVCRQGEFVITGTGLEGSLVYAFSAAIRETIALRGEACVHLDLLPGRSAAFVEAEVARPRGSRSLATHLKSRLGLDGVRAGLLRELLTREQLADARSCAAAIKALPLRLAAPRPIREVISSAGGVPFEAMDPQLMLHALPGVFCAGEMLDWEAPTGGYLLTACLASGWRAGHGAAAALQAMRA